MRDFKVGETVYYFDIGEDGKYHIDEMTVDEIRQETLTVAHRYPTGIVMERHMDDVFRTDDEALAYIHMEDGVILQREEGQGKVAISVHSFDPSVFQFLQLRSRYNPELRYFYTHKCRIDDYNLLETMKDEALLSTLLESKIIATV